MDVRKKVALVTGAGTGVGRATALRLAAEGCSVAINYNRSQEAGEAVAEEARAHGVQAVAIQADIANDDDCRRLVATTHQELGGLNILVNNAGTTKFVPHADLDRIDMSDWQRIMAVNVVGPFQCARAALPLIRSNGGGEIVNTSSVAGVGGVGSSIPYCASKAALNNLTVTLARVAGPDVRVNAVAPGFLDGSWLQEGMGSNFELGKQYATSASTLEKVCSPSDIGHAIVALICGPDVQTGQCILVDAGLLLGKGA